MNREDLIRKLDNEAELSTEIEAALDHALGESERISEYVRLLPSEHPSMEWQAKVHEQTRVIVKKARRAAGWPARVAGVSIMGAAVCAVFVTSQLSRMNTPERIPTEAMLNWHDEAVAVSVLPGDGITLEGASALPSEPAGKSDLFDGGSLHSL